MALVFRGRIFRVRLGLAAVQANYVAPESNRPFNLNLVFFEP
jgi:hypothetical protein